MRFGGAGLGICGSACSLLLPLVSLTRLSSPICIICFGVFRILHSLHEPVKPFHAWILWNIWKGRDACVFEKKRTNAHCVLAKSLDEAEEWLCLNKATPVSTTPREIPEQNAERWVPASPPSLKCNIGASWISSSQNCGAAWLIRDYSGNTLHHSRRSYASIPSYLEAALLSFLWVADCLDNLHYSDVVFEFSSPEVLQTILKPHSAPRFSSILMSIHSVLNKFQQWQLREASHSMNVAAQSIAASVTRDHRYQSYIASGGPLWLQQTLNLEASHLPAH